MNCLHHARKAQKTSEEKHVPITSQLNTIRCVKHTVMPSCQNSATQSVDRPIKKIELV